VEEVLGEYQREHEIEQDKHNDENDHLYDHYEQRIRKPTYKESKKEIELMIKSHKLRRNVSLDFVPGAHDVSELHLKSHNNHLEPINIRHETKRAE
jgi:acetyl-CoA carboxylase carboxyltransferase component